MQNMDQEIDPLAGEIGLARDAAGGGRHGRGRGGARAGERPALDAQHEGLHPGLRRGDRPAEVDLPHHPGGGRVRQRHVAERLVALHGEHRSVGPDQRGPGAGHRLSPDGDADQRLLRRPPPRRQPLLGQPGGGRHRDRGPAVALPVHPPRRLGLGPAVRADPGRRRDRRRVAQDRGAAEQAVVAVRLRPGDRRAHLAHRGARGGAVERAGRAAGAHAAVRDEAARLRPAGRRPRRPDRLHARAAAAGGGGRVAPPHGSPSSRRPPCRRRTASSAR